MLDLWQKISESALAQEQGHALTQLLGALPAIVNAVAGLALLSIAASLVTLVKRTRIPYPGLFVIFAVCVAASGVGRLSGMIAVWSGASWHVPLIGAVAALTSAVAAVSLRRMMPRLVKAVQGLTLSETRRKMLEDYSDELKAVNHLREREARDFEAIVASSSDQIYRIGLDGKFEYTSPAVTKFFGFPKSELFGKGWDHLRLEEETRLHLEECQADVFQGGAEARGNITLKSLDGTRHFDYLCSPILERKRVIAVTFNFRDVTDKRTFETELVRAYSEMERRVEQRTEELSISRKRYEELVNTIDGIVWESDVGRPGFTFVGSQAERITGHPVTKWLEENRFWQRILHPDDLARITGDRYVHPDQKNDVKAEYRILTADDRVLWVRDHVRVIHENGRPVKMRGIMVDVTEQKKAEEALEKERQISLRAASVKSEFLANMSHEIRTPLNAIVGMSSLALGCTVDAEARECLSTVKTAADSLLLLVNDILDFSKIEAGGIRLEISDFRIRALVKNALDVIQPLAAEKGVALVREESPLLERAVRGDSGRLLQVLLNLLGNAVKFTPKGGEVRLTMGENGGAVHFEVRDNGIGIAEDAQKVLFQPFIQADSSTARKFGGTGLGLSISKRLVELMEGRIGVQSAPGKGSLFWFELPLPAALGEVREQEDDESAEASLAGTRVLVADDNPANQKVILRLLEKLGCRPESVTNGREALAAVHDRPYDIVLMDCQMPDMDGYEATRRIRAGGLRVPVVALTAHALAGDREKCREAGMDDYLSKPVTIRDLARALARWKKRATAIEGGRAAPDALDPKYLESLDQLNGHGKSDIVRDLAQIFFETAAVKLTAIREAAESGALDKARFESHSLKSTSHNVGAVRLAKACEEIEYLAETGPPEAFAERRELLLRRLDREAEAASKELRRVLEQRAAA